MNDKWLEITIDAPSEELEEVCARLTAAGMAGLVIEDEAEFHRFLEENRQFWDYVDDELLERMKGTARVKFYVTDDDLGRAQLAGYTENIPQPYTVLPLAEDDWAHSWQKYYRPLEIGKRLYIIPDWERDTAPVPPGRVPLYLNPGLTFGTGSHASTQLCLEGLEDVSPPGGDVLDLGCGSGILSVAALKLGAASAAAVDIDPKAVGVAYENAALNGIGQDRYTVMAGNILEDDALVARLSRRRYGLVLANIVADVIIPLSAFAGRFLTQDGVFLCSGILEARAGEVAQALEKNGLAVTGLTAKNGWAALTARLRA